MQRHIPIVTALDVPSSCVVRKMPTGTNSGTRRRKRKFSLLFKHDDRGRIEIDHLYCMCCRGWYCYRAQHDAGKRDRKWPKYTTWTNHNNSLWDVIDHSCTYISGDWSNRHFIRAWMNNHIPSFKWESLLFHAQYRWWMGWSLVIKAPSIVSGFTVDLSI